MRLALRRLWSRPTVRVTIGLGLAAFITPVSAVLTRSFMVEVPASLREEAKPSRNSVRVVSRDGEPLADLRPDQGKRHVELPLAEFGERLPAALLAAEDRWFYEHNGIDVAALLRATLQSAASGRITGGASTLTQQLARRSIDAPRSFAGKFEVMALSLEIEREFSKDEILERYLNRVDFGPNIEGAEAAAIHTFGKRAKSLSLSQAAALASIPRGPTLYDPRKGTERILRRRDRVLDRMEKSGLASTADVSYAKAEPLEVATSARLGLAPHLVRSLTHPPSSCSEAPSWDERAAVIHTTLDGDLQLEVEAASRRAVAASDKLGITAVSVVVLDNATGDVLAYVGSPNQGDVASLGQNDGVRALRQPGSALKPFVYATALEKGLLEPNSLLPDVELSFHAGEGDAFRPQNYNRKFQGPVMLREALGNSLNVPAVWVADALTPGVLLESFRGLGFCSLTEPAAHYGVGLALGGGEVTLLDLTAAYTMLARGGVAVTPRFVSALEQADGSRLVTSSPSERRVLDRDVALFITDVLSDRRARRAAFGEATVFDFPFAVAAKTGTSKGYRDNLAVGFSTRVTVGVWAGNFDGSPMNEVSGISGAGPLFREAMSAANRRYPGEDRFDAPARYESREVCALSGRAATSRCPHGTREWVSSGASQTCEMHRSIAIDPENDLLAGPACDDAESRVFEVYPPLYQRWADEARRPIAPDRVSPRCPELAPRSTTDRARVLYPEDGARFYLESGRGAQIRLRGAFPRERRAFFVLDGRTIPVDTDGSAVITLERGKHSLSAAIEGARATEEISFTVE